MCWCIPSVYAVISTVNQKLQAVCGLESHIINHMLSWIGGRGSAEVWGSTPVSMISLGLWNKHRHVPVYQIALKGTSLEVMENI